MAEGVLPWLPCLYLTLCVWFIIIIINYIYIVLRRGNSGGSTTGCVVIS